MSSVLTLPLDPTGSAVSNLVTGEVQSIGTSDTRAFPVNYGLFFRASLIVTDVASGVVLTEGTQYYPTQMDLDASLNYGEELDSIVVIVDKTVGATVSVSYQALGGINNLSQAAVKTTIAGLAINDGAVPWASVTNTPAKYPVAAHQHIADDLYGLEYIVDATTRLNNAILAGQGAAEAELLAYAVAVIAELQGELTDSIASLQAHENNVDNPHATTALQVGSYTTEQTQAALALEASNRTTIDNTLAATLANHIANTADPHELTTAQLGAYSRAQSDSAMTAMQTALTLTITGNEATQIAHIANYNNPHDVTAAQIGTWTASQIASAITAAATAEQALVSAFVAVASAHEANVSNPHGDTAANIGTWTQPTINTAIVAPYTAHAANLANPHQDTYTELGAYATAAINADIANKYATIVNDVNALNGTVSSHVNNGNNPHQDTLANTGAGGYTAAYLQNLINVTLHTPTY